MAGTYTASERTVGELLAFTSRPLRVPTWQRSFSWRTQEVATFLEDLLRFSERYPGDNVKAKEYFLGSVVLVDRTDYLEILDGQQRLATATMLLAALRDVAKDHDADASRDIARDYIAKKDPATDETVYKLRLNSYDRDFFRDTVQRQDGTPPDPDLASHNLISTARDYLVGEVEKRYKAAGKGKLGYTREIQRLLNVLVHHVSVVEVTARDEDSAAAVFETLNDRGIGLSTPDLLRNLLLLRAKNDSDRDEIVDVWEQVFDLGGEGISVEDFLRHYWISTHGDVKAKALYREIKADIEDRDTNSLTLSKSLAKSAGDYAAVVDASSRNRELRLALEAAQALNAKVLLPVLLSARAVGTQDQQAKLATLLVSVFVRHTLIGGLAGSDFESVAFELAADLRKKKDFDKAIKRLRDFAPSDAEFRKAFATASVGRLRSARYLLTAIEHHYRGTGEVRVEDPDMVHVEHVYPQRPGKGRRWSKHDVLVNRLGNLTLLSKRFNQSIRNGPFSTKKDKAYEGSDIKITQKLLAYSKWTESQINDRQKWLADAAVKVWTI
jgi:uncharacterized protein DUF262/uncharacterized protein DUF1524